MIRAAWHTDASYTTLHSEWTRHTSNGTIAPNIGGYLRGKQCTWFGQSGTFTLLLTHTYRCRRFHRSRRSILEPAGRPGTRAQACTSEGSTAEHCKLTFRARHPCSTVDPCSCPSGTAPAATARPISLQTIAIEAGSISGRGQGSRLQASDGSQACSARSPGAAPPLTMLARRGLHSGRRPAVDRGAGRQEFDSQACTILPM